ncbi:MAG TPA: hypothetical protein VMW46_00570 [Candidatus Desulfaltia sp.]|nr:hypothetical protein [Candidatus Desulfaltia sp.]
MRKERLFVRNFEAGAHLETFLVAAVASILIIRLFLKVTGYPKLGGVGLHIAHVLWGGLLMAAAILMLLLFLGKSRERVAVVAGGVGFGYFIDEVGKFLTNDNDYFFRPSVAVMYVVFILIVVSVRSIQAAGFRTDLEYLMNAVRELEEIAWRNIDEEEKRKIQFYLSRSPSGHPLVAPLKEVINKVEVSQARPPGPTKRLKAALHVAYRKIASSSWFHHAIVIFFLFQLAVNLAYIIVLVFFKGLGWKNILSVGVFDRVASNLETLTFVDWAELASSVISAAFVFLGILFLPRNRLLALGMFERAVLVSIFLTQVFVFYKEQFGALLGLIINLLILAALRFMIEKEQFAVISLVRGRGD